MTSSNKPTEFSDLSKELRLMIWDLTLSPRLLTFSLIGYPSHGGIAPAYAIKSKHRFILQEVTSPAALAICSESRNLALRLGYKPSSFTINSDTGLIWNPKLDIIYLPSLWGFYTFEFFQKCFPSESKEVQRLQLSSEMIWPQREMSLSPIVGFESLKMIIVLHSDALERGSGGPVRIEYRKLPKDRREIEARIAQFWPQWSFPEIKVVEYSDEILEDV